jgi:hypothetical protein
MPCRATEDKQRIAFIRGEKFFTAALGIVEEELSD